MWGFGSPDCSLKHLGACIDATQSLNAAFGAEVVNSSSAAMLVAKLRETRPRWLRRIKNIALSALKLFPFPCWLPVGAVVHTDNETVIDATALTRRYADRMAPVEGSAHDDGVDMCLDHMLLRQHIGVVPEKANVCADLMIWQNVMLMPQCIASANASARLEYRNVDGSRSVSASQEHGLSDTPARVSCGALGPLTVCLPKTTADMPLQPCDAMIIKSHAFFWAVSMMPDRVFMLETCRVAWDTCRLRRSCYHVQIFLSSFGKVLGIHRGRVRQHSWLDRHEMIRRGKDWRPRGDATAKRSQSGKRIRAS
jgi:hypothetical protein